MEEFTITLPTSVTTTDTNTVASWKTKLASRIELRGKWVVGLKEISYPKSWYNITTSADLSMMTQIEGQQDDSELGVSRKKRKDKVSIVDGSYEITLLDVIPKGYYSSAEEVASALNKGIRKIITTSNSQADKSLMPRIDYLNYSNKLRFSAGEGIHPETSETLWTTFWFSDEFQKMLGFNEVDTWEFGVELRQSSLQRTLTKDASRPFDLLGGVRGIYVYCNVVKPRLLGDTYSQILRVVEVPSVSLPFGEQFSKLYENPNYLPVNCSYIDKIHLEVCDDTGRNIPFMFGKGHIVLSFKQISK